MLFTYNTADSNLTNATNTQGALLATNTEGSTAWRNDKHTTYKTADCAAAGNGSPGDDDYAVACAALTSTLATLLSTRNTELGEMNTSADTQAAKKLLKVEYEQI